MNTLSPRWRAAGSAALFLLVTWACNCGTFQRIEALGGGAGQTPESVIIEEPTLPTATEAPALPPPTEVTLLPPAPESTLSPPTEAPAGAPPPAGALFEDDFSNPGSGWYVDDSPEEGSYAYENGVYAITALSNGLQMWGNAGRSFGDVIVEVDAAQVSGPANGNNAYGVGCRIQENGDGYFLRISADGYYAIYVVTSSAGNEETTFTALLDWTQSGAINQGNASNHITVTCAGSSLSLSVNGQMLGSTQNGTYASGDIAVTATTFEAEPTTIHYDNVVVREP